MRPWARSSQPLKVGEVGHRAHKPTRCRGTTIVLIRLHAVLCCSPESDTEDGERKENPRKGSSLADTCTTNLLGNRSSPAHGQRELLPSLCMPEAWLCLCLSLLTLLAMWPFNDCLSIHPPPFSSLHLILVLLFFPPCCFPPPFPSLFHWVSIDGMKGTFEIVLY